MDKNIIESIDVVENKIVFTVWGHKYTLTIPLWVARAVVAWYESEDA